MYKAQINYTLYQTENATVITIVAHRNDGLTDAYANNKSRLLDMLNKDFDEHLVPILQEVHGVDMAADEPFKNCPDCGIDMPVDETYCNNADCPNYKGHAVDEDTCPHCGRYKYDGHIVPNPLSEDDSSNFCTIANKVL